MGRPKGSKNKPKIVPSENQPQQVKVEASPSLEVPIVKKKRGRPKGSGIRQYQQRQQVVDGKVILTEVENCPAEISLDNSEFGFYPINMSHFLFTEHRLLKSISYLLTKLSAKLFNEYTAAAAKEGVDYKIYVVKHIMKSLGCSTDDISNVIKEIEEYKQTNKPTQLYAKYRKR